MAKGEEAQRRYGGGGGADPANIRNAQGLYAIQNGTSIESNREVVALTRDITDRYGIDAQTGGMLVADFVNKDSNTLGCYHVGGGITMNRAFMGNNERMNNAYDGCVRNGFHPSRGNKSGIYAVAAHEYGHSLTENAREAMGMGNFDDAATRIVTEARHITKDRGNIKFASKISKYATASDAETIAEAVSDFMCNGSKATAQSRAIVEVLDRYLLNK